MLLLLWSIIKVMVMWLLPVLLMIINSIINSDNIYEAFIHTPQTGQSTRFIERMKAEHEWMKNEWMLGIILDLVVGIAINQERAKKPFSLCFFFWGYSWVISWWHMPIPQSVRSCPLGLWPVLSWTRERWAWQEIMEETREGALYSRVVLRDNRMAVQHGDWECRFCGQTAWFWIPALPLSSCVTWSWTSHCTLIPTSEGFMSLNEITNLNYSVQIWHKL